MFLLTYHLCCLWEGASTQKTNRSNGGAERGVRRAAQVDDAATAPLDGAAVAQPPVLQGDGTRPELVVRTCCSILTLSYRGSAFPLLSNVNTATKRNTIFKLQKKKLHVGVDKLKVV